jgi:hypothetical protein
MKKSIKFSAVLIVLFCSVLSAYSQGVVSPPANATATIIAPIAIAKTTDMAFGNIAVGAGGGTIVLSTAGARSATGDASYQAAPAATAAVFTVTGIAAATYAITLPASTTITGPGTMTVDSFTSNPNGTGTLTGGTSNLLVGATLHVSGAQAAGAYTGTFTVTVAYN